MLLESLTIPVRFVTYQEYKDNYPYASLETVI